MSPPTRWLRRAGFAMLTALSLATGVLATTAATVWSPFGPEQTNFFDRLAADVYYDKPEYRRRYLHIVQRPRGRLRRLLPSSGTDEHPAVLRGGRWPCGLRSSQACGALGPGLTNSKSPDLKVTYTQPVLNCRSPASPSPGMM